MKRTFCVFVFFSLLTMLTTSCQKENSIKTEPIELEANSLTKTSANLEAASIARNETFELKVKPLSQKQIQNIAKKLQKKKSKTTSTTNRIDVIEEVPIEGEVPITDDVAEIQDILNPLVQNGRQIHSEIISKISISEDWISLTYEEKNSILNLTDDQLGELSLIYSTVNIEEWQTEPIEALRIDLGTIRSCLSGALGLGDLYYLVVENPRALLSANGALKILKHVGLRYLGWIGLGLAVWDFVDCVS